ncbi:MAG TPA: YcxB family protein [Candidatus Binatia bacterium]
MKVSADIDRRDVFLVRLFSLPRSRANWYFTAILALIFFAFLLFRAPGISVLTILVAAFVAVGAAVGALLGGFLANSAQMMLTPEKNSGVCGLHDFSLSPTGLHESTAVNDSLYQWSGIQSVVRVRSYMLVHINNYSAYVIPRRSFASNAEFDAFFEQAATRWESAQQLERK